jgi:tRNA pseudouridine55 synthase
VEREIAGVLLVDKPAGPSSHDVVARVRTLFHTRTVGHTGTLDPFATGLLILVLGSATRLARWAERRPKTYRAVARLGQTTETDDRTGAVREERTPAEWPERSRVESALRGFLGSYRQQPPAYSAKRVGGVRSYRAARRGQEPLQLAPVPVTVHAAELLDYAAPILTFRAEVGPGTYLRALARDLGERLGTGAHLTELRRERIGPWRVENATPLVALTGAEPLLAPASLVEDLARIELTAEEARLVRHGRDLERAGAETAMQAGLFQGDHLVAIAERVSRGWHPAVVLPGPA